MDYFSIAVRKLLDSAVFWFFFVPPILYTKMLKKEKIFLPLCLHAPKDWICNRCQGGGGR